MASNSEEYTSQQYRKYNGQTVFKALSAMGNEGSAEDLATFISEDIGMDQGEILPEIKQVLRRGVSNGFLERKGHSYRFYHEEIQTDSGRRRKRNRVTLPKMIERDDDSDESTDEGSADGVDDEENPEEMQTDGRAPRRSRVRLYSPFKRDSSDDDESDEEPPRRKKHGAQSNMKRK